MDNDTKTVWLYLPDQWADWEPGFLTSELNTGRYFRDPSVRRPVRVAADTSAPVASMGGLRVLPDATLRELDPGSAALLVVPGANTWLAPERAPILDKVREFIAAGVPVAAICGATHALAEAGLLDNRAHTSDDISAFEYLCPNYHGSAQYVDARVVTGDGVTTAGGTSPVHFAGEVLRVLDVMRPETVDAWEQLKLTADPRHYAALMATTS